MESSLSSDLLESTVQRSGQRSLNKYCVNTRSKVTTLGLRVAGIAARTAA